MKLNECSCGCGGMSDSCTSNQKEQENQEADQRRKDLVLR